MGLGRVGLRPAVMLYRVLFLAHNCASRSVVTGGSCLPAPWSTADLGRVPAQQFLPSGKHVNYVWNVDFCESAQKRAASPMKLQVTQSAPRARGDGPDEEPERAPVRNCSPRTRGWSRSAPLPAWSDRLLPAHAGMVPRTAPSPRGIRTAPRARGDGPARMRHELEVMYCSPRTRGWSLPAVRLRRIPPLLPAHAGMVPLDDWLRPATESAPRVRGDGPSARPSRQHSGPCSPRTRGWSLGVGADHADTSLLPAHAGMVPIRPWRRENRSPAPRARGDGPAWTPASGNIGTADIGENDHGRPCTREAAVTRHVAERD